MPLGVTNGGKRVRAMMLIGGGEGWVPDPQRLLDLPCASEMVHSASLYVDQL